jgi:hypothetical protein
MYMKSQVEEGEGSGLDNLSSQVYGRSPRSESDTWEPPLHL